MSPDINQLERLTMRAWPGLEEEWRDGWLLRFAHGYTGRANSVNPLAAPTLPVADNIAYCERWYAARNLPTRFRLNPASTPADLDSILAGRGYERIDDVLVMALPLPATWPAGEEAHVMGLDDWFAGKNSPTARIQRAIIEKIEPTKWLVGWRVDGQLVARALGVLEEGWLGIFNVAVEPTHRRHGIGRALMNSMLRQAQLTGAQGAYLQVVADNAAAVNLYTGLGFRPAYHYWYRRQATVRITF